MAHAKLLQDWITLQVPASGNVVQDESGWLDLPEYDDIVIWSQVRSSSNVSSLAVQTSPTKDDGWFTNMATPSVTASATPVVTPLIFASASTPLARYLRWRVLAAGSDATITFRIWIVANPIR